MLTTKIILPLSLLMCVSCSTLSKSKTPKPNAPKIPFLKNAEVKTIWIPDRIEGNRFEEGHFIHIIDKQSSWTR